MKVYFDFFLKPMIADSQEARIAFWITEYANNNILFQNIKISLIILHYIIYYEFCKKILRGLPP